MRKINSRKITEKKLPRFVYVILFMPDVLKVPKSVSLPSWHLPTKS